MCDIPEIYANDKYLDREVYKEYYPIDMYEPMMQHAEHDLKLHHEKRDNISKILNDPHMSIFDKFCRFIDIMNKEDLYYLGW